MISALILIAAVMPSREAPKPANEVVLLVETIVAPSVQQVDAGEVIDSETVRIPDGDHFLYDFKDPRDNHSVQVELQLWVGESKEQVKAALSIQDRTTKQWRIRGESLVIDGQMVLTLYPLEGSKGARFLRLTPKTGAEAL